MKLLTKAIEKKLPPLYSQGNKKAEEVKVMVKFFHPASRWTWYGYEYDPEERVFFGFVKSGLDPDFDELGYFSLDELEHVNVNGMKIERDKFFGFEHTLAEVMGTGEIDQKWLPGGAREGTEENEGPHHLD